MGPSIVAKLCLCLRRCFGIRTWDRFRSLSKEWTKSIVCLIAGSSYRNALRRGNTICYYVELAKQRRGARTSPPRCLCDTSCLRKEANHQIPNGFRLLKDRFLLHSSPRLILRFQHDTQVCTCTPRTSFPRRETTLTAIWKYLMHSHIAMLPFTGRRMTLLRITN